ncbi:MAG TPA: hypothetical protein VHO90_21010 [Bacteroidales bacterium]|nr:hypothetical protein [Bacteroidales bacterium]
MTSLIRTTLFVALISFFSSHLPAQFSQSKINLPVYPSFKEMASKFFSNYSFPKATDYQKYSFAKKPDGWHILLTDHSKEKVVEDYFFWDRGNNKYKILYFPGATRSGKLIPAEYDTWDNNYFNTISPYYGYIGWDEDVIRNYEDKTNLSDSVLNALARAYTSYTANLLGTGSYSDPLKRFKLKSDRNALTDEQLRTYRKYEHLSIETYYRLYQLNPRFENFVGDIFTVYSNQVMTAFLNIRYLQNEAEAQKELKSNLYDPFYLSIAKNYLASCDSNAIIFTNGDNDTFPLLYVQENEGFRRDVLVVNVSLLQSSHYIDHLFERIGVSDPITTQIGREKYYSGTLSYAYIIEKIKEDEHIELNDLMKFISSTDTATKYKYNDEYIPYIPTSRFQLTVDKKKVLNTGIVSPADSATIVPVMKWDWNKKSVIYQNEIAMLDIIATAAFSRPIYIALTVDDEYYLGLNDYLQCDGFAYKIVPVKYHGEEYPYGSIDCDALYKKLKDEFYYANLTDGSVVLSESHQRMITVFKNQYARLADELIKENKPDSAREILGLYFERFPLKEVPADYFMIPFAKCFYQLKETKKANNLVSILFATFTAKLEDCKKKGMTPSDFETGYGLAALSQLRDLTAGFNQSSLSNSIQASYDEYYGYFHKY